MAALTRSDDNQQLKGNSMGFIILKRAALTAATAAIAFAAQAAQTLPIDPDGQVNAPGNMAIHKPLDADPGERLEAAAKLGRQSMTEPQKHSMMFLIRR